MAVDEKPLVSGRTDHGTAIQAINFALNFKLCCEPDTFLRSWREGDLRDWPEFYGWLSKNQDQKGSGE